MPEHLIIYLLREYGMTGLLLVVGASMVSAAWAQIVFLKRWQPQTVQLAERAERIIRTMEAIVERQDRQHATCTRHYEFASEQIDGMKALGTELQAVVRSIHESDRERNREILQLMSLIAGRPRVTD